MDQGKKPRTRRGSGKNKKGGHGAGKSAAAAGGGRGGAQAQPQSQGRVQAPRIVTVPITTAPKKKDFVTLEDLASSAANTNFSQEKRLASLHQLEKVLSTSTGQNKASRFFDGVAPPLLRVLWDADAVLSTAAVSTVTAWLTPLPNSSGSSDNSSSGAALTGGLSSSSAAAVAPNASTEHPGSLILGLLLPILSLRKFPDRLSALPPASSTTEASSWTSLAPHQLISVLIISRECLSTIPGLAAFKRASAVFSAALSIIEQDVPIPTSSPAVEDAGATAGQKSEVDESSGVADSSYIVVIGPVFELLLQALKVHHVPSHTALSLGDAVLRWARRSDLPGSVRPVLARAMHAVGAAWSSAGDSNASQSENNNVVQLLEEILNISSSASSASYAQVLLNLTACAVPFIVRALTLRESTGKDGKKHGSVWEKMEPLVVLLINKFTELVEESGKMEDREHLITAEEVQELCRYLNSIIAAVLKPPTTSRAGVGEQQTVVAPHPRPHLLLRPAEETKVQEDTAYLPSEPVGKENDPCSLLAAAIRFYTTALQRQDILHQPEKSSSLAKDLLSWINQLPHDIYFIKIMEDSLVQLALPPKGPLSVLRSSATSPAVVQPVALLYVQLLTRLPLLFHSILDEIKTTFYSSSNSSGMAVASKLAFDVNVLLAAIKAGVSKESQERIWPTMAELLCNFSNFQKEQREMTARLNDLVPKLVQIAQLALASSPQETAEEGKTSEKWCRALELAGQLLESTPKLAAQMLHWQLQCISKVSVQHKNGAEAVICALQGAKKRLRHPNEASVRSSAFCILEAVLQKYSSSSERNYVGKTILNESQVVELCEAALVAAAEDTEEKVAQQAKRVVLACSVPIAFLLLSGQCTSLTSNFSRFQPLEETWNVVIDPRQRGFTSSQLSQVLDFIAGSAAPASNVLVGGGQAAQKGIESPPDEWLVHLVQEMEVLKYVGEGEEVHESMQLADERSSSNSSSPAATAAASLWWLVLQTAAKQCVESKLTTHWGGAAQTLGMLERAVQKFSSSRGKSGTQQNLDFDFASKSSQTTSHISQVLTPGVRLAGVCLLHFLFALEQELGAAISGSVVRCPPNKTAALYFSGNRNVCEEWLARLRPAAAIAATDLKLYHLAIYHGLRRLDSLKKQGDELQVKISEEESTQEEGGETLAVVGGKEEKKLGLLRRPQQATSSTVLSLSSLSLEQNTKRKSSTIGELTLQEKLAALVKNAVEAASLLSSALCALHESDAIAGVHSFCTQLVSSLNSPFEAPFSSSSSSLFDWLQAAELGARGNYEAAIELLLNNNNNSQQGGDQSSPAAMVVGAEAYAALHDWDGLQEWLSKTARPGSLVAQPELEEYSEMARWGFKLSSSSCSSSSTPEETIENTVRSENILLQGHSSNSKTAALEALFTFSALGKSQNALDSTSNRILTNFILAQSSVGEFGLLPKCALPDIAENMGALAALQLAVDPFLGAGKHLLDPCLALTESNVFAKEFSAWEGGNEFVCTPAAVDVAHSVLAGITTAAAGATRASSKNSVLVNNTSLALLLRLRTAAVSQATGNLSTAKKLYAAVDAMVRGNTELDVEIGARLRLHQQRVSIGAVKKLSPAELAQSYERACTLKCAPSGGEAIGHDASICWHYAQYLKQNVLESGKEEEKEEEHIEKEVTACLGSIAAAAKALSLAGSSSLSDDLGVLPSVLFIYRMLVDNADVISIHEETLLSSLDQVPFPSWRLIIPQLISLLTTSSRKPALQRIASHLLLKAAGSFSSVSTDASTTEDITRVLLPAMVELHQRQQSSNTIETPSTLSHPSSSLQTLVNTLKTRDPPLYEDLSEFIQSLASLALLEDERWHAVLVEAQGTLTKRLAGAYAYLKTLRPKDFSSSSITPTTSYGSVFLDAATEEVACAVAPVLAALRCHVAAAEIAAAAAAATASKGRPVTRHEKHFREKMNLVSKLHWMLEQLELPLQLVAGEAAAAGALEAALQKPLQAIKKIASEVAAVGMTVTELDLADVCPKLAAVIGAGAGGSARRSRLRVPRGLGNMITSTATSSSPFIESIEPEVKVLHTKTRPKKITLRGSDGNAYSFLVKGREDLRVDLAVSTFFAAADRALSASNTKRRSSTSSPAVMPLTVVPVGPQAGLVGWVERTKPLYGVYASYEAQQAQRAAGLAAATLAQTPSPSVAAALNTSASSKQDKKYKRGGKKPSKDGTELTKTQIKKNKKAEKEAAAAASAAAQAALDKAKQPLRPSDLFRSKLKAAGVNTSSPRSTWPLKALKSVFIDLSATAPHNMIANELLSSAAGPAHWWSRQHHYTTSTAVMSIFGYLLGVGDRHLDNVLLQSYTGTVLHVDFGVLFNRGMKLHVPEVVPFRLTHSFAAGLGVTGVEGKFKREAEAALDAVRKNVEPLRMLLQSFVEDPLISWAPEVGVKSSRLGFERCVELIHFMRSMEELFKEKETTTIDVDAAVKRVNSVLQRVSTDVGPFCSIFFKTQKALATVSEHQQQIERCSRIIEDGKVEDLALQYTLSVTATEIENLSSQLETAVHSVRLLEATHSSFGSISSKSLLASSPYAGILASIFDGQLGASLHAALPAWDPSLAAVPLGMVQSYSGARELTLVNVALGVEPSRVPVNASLLLKAATVDDAGKEAFRKGAEAIRNALAAVQHYANAVNALNTIISTSDEKSTSSFFSLSSLYSTLLTQGSTSRTAAAPDTSRVLSTWHSLKIHCRASTSFLTNLINTQNTLKLERIDVALAAADAKEKLAAAVATSPPVVLLKNLEEFTDQVAGQVKLLAMDTEPTADLIDALQHILMGYATVVLTSDDSTGGSWLMKTVPWLRSAVEAADSISSVAGEMQLIIPRLTSLIASNDDTVTVSNISKAFTALEEKLENYADLASSDAFAIQEQEVSVAVMAQLVDMSSTWPIMASFLQCLHGVQVATTSHAAMLGGGSSNGRSDDQDEITARAIKTGPVLLKVLSKQSTSPHWECLELAAAAVDTWNDLLTTAAIDPGSDRVGSIDLVESIGDAELDIVQKSVGCSVSAAVSISVQIHFLPAVHAVMKKTCAELKNKAKNLPEGKKPTASNAVKKEKHAMKESFTGSITTATDTYDGTSMFLERGKEEGRFQDSAEPLPAFFDFVNDDDNGDDVSLSLESGALENEEDEGVLQLGEQIQQLDIDIFNGGSVGLEESQEHVIASNSEVSSWEQLSNVLSLCSDASGALAAVDAVLHVTASTMHQAAQQAQQAQADLAAHQWMYEPLLIHSTQGITPEDLKKALQQEGFETGGRLSKLALLPSALELSLSALLTPRYEVLSNLKYTIAGLQSAEEEIQKWKDVAVPIENCFSGELLRIAPTIASHIEVCLEAGHGWRNTAVMHGIHLKDALNAVVECEAARDSHAAAQKEENKQGNAAAGDQELQMQIEKDKEEYRKAVEHVHDVHAALSTAQSSFTTHQNELNTLRKEVNTAAEEISNIQKHESTAAEQVSNVALPLVKAMQKLPTTLQTIQEYLGNVDVAVEVLSTMQRRLARVHAATAPSSFSNVGGNGNGDGSTRLQISFQVQISKILENLSTSVDFLRTLPTVLHTLQYSVDAARRSLLQHGGRGVVAAREQAGDVVRLCKDAMEKLQPLIDTAESNALKISVVSPLLGDLIPLAKDEIDALCAQHNFTCNSVCGRDAGVAFASSSSICESSVHLYLPPSPLEKIHATAETGLVVFASSAMQQFKDKVDGTDDVIIRRRTKNDIKDKGDSRANRRAYDGEGDRISVSECVEALIEDATDVDNLARMYEGWMPWI